MDPLSAAASVIAVVGAIAGVSRSVKKIASLRAAPEAVLTLNNEISDLQVVLRAIETTLQTNTNAIDFLSSDSLHQPLNRAKEKLLELSIILEYQIIKVGDGGELTINSLAWARKYSKIKGIQNDLRLIRLNLATILGGLAS